MIYLDITWFISVAENLRDTVKYMQREVIKELSENFPHMTNEQISLPIALSDVCKASSLKFIIIIDEWDALFREAKEMEDLQKEYIQLLRSLFKSSQTDQMIEAAYITGILPIKKYGTQSALTDFQEYTMLQPKKLAEYTGFTEMEVRRLCIDCGMDFKEIKRWYDGYSFRGLDSVYSPNSVMQAIVNGEIGSYWTQTETYESLKIYIDMDLDGLQKVLMQMLGGMRCGIDIGTFQNDMINIKNRDDVLTLLIHLGYLAYDAQQKAAYIPNEEVRQEFLRGIKAGRHQEIAKLIRSSDQLLQDTLNMECQKVESAIQKIHMESSAPTFYNNEQALRSVIHFVENLS